MEIFAKICGICNREDAQLCSEAGADAIGILLRKPDKGYARDSDRVTIEEASKLVSSLPKNLKAICLIHETDYDETAAILKSVRPWGAQFQKEVDQIFLTKIGYDFPDLFVIKTFHMKDDVKLNDLLVEIRLFTDAGCIDAVLLDSARGGSGKAHDWQLSKKVVQALDGIPVIVAGGLRADNVQGMISEVQPWGVDVMSGVTSEFKNKKSEDSVRSFLGAVRALHLD